MLPWARIQPAVTIHWVNNVFLFPPFFFFDDPTPTHNLFSYPTTFFLNSVFFFWILPSLYFLSKDMMSEMKTAAILSKMVADDASVVPASQVFHIHVYIYIFPSTNSFVCKCVLCVFISLGGLLVFFSGSHTLQGIVHKTSVTPGVQQGDTEVVGWGRRGRLTQVDSDRIFFLFVANQVTKWGERF